MILSGLSLDIRAKIQTIDYALGLVHAGLGCALVPAHSEVLNRSDIVFRPIDGLCLMREIIFAYQQNSIAIDNFKKIVVTHRK